MMGNSVMNIETESVISQIAFNMDRRLGFIAKLPLIIGGFFELG